MYYRLLHSAATLPIYVILYNSWYYFAADTRRINRKRMGTDYIYRVHPFSLRVIGTEPYVKDIEILQKSRSHLQILDARRATKSKFYAEGPQILGAALWNVLASAKWRLGFVHPCRMLLSYKYLSLHMPIKRSLRLACCFLVTRVRVVILNWSVWMPFCKEIKILPNLHQVCRQNINSYLVCTLTLRLLMSYIYGAPILDVSRSHTTTQHSR